MIMTKEKKIYQHLTSSNICEIYKLLHNEGLVSFPPTASAIEKIDATIANINGESFGVAHYETVEKKIVAHLYFIIKNHAFTDGNKRTAILVFLVLCSMNKLHEKRNTQYNLDELAVFLEQQKNTDHHILIEVIANAIFKNGTLE